MAESEGGGTVLLVAGPEWWMAVVVVHELVGHDSGEGLQEIISAKEFSIQVSYGN